MEDDRYEYHGWVISNGKEEAKRFLDEILNSEEWLGWEYLGMSNCGKIYTHSQFFMFEKVHFLAGLSNISQFPIN